jgi:hypothetical protein
MKTWWKIRNKPRGHFCPMLEFGISLNPKDEKEIKDLNIKPEVEFCYLTVLSETRAPKCGRIPFILPEWVFYKNDPNYPDPVVLNECGDKDKNLCDKCVREKFMLFATHINIHLSHHVYLPWRSGPKPDYSDFINSVRAFLDQVLLEIDRRLNEARESAPSEEWGLEEELSLEASAHNQRPSSDKDRLRVVRIGAV